MALEKTLVTLEKQAHGLLDLVYPPVCGLCGNLADSADRLVCPRCWATIDGFPRPYCLECKSFLSTNITCPICRKRPVPIFSLGYFDDRLRAIIYDLKFGGLKPLGRPLGNKLASIIAHFDLAPGIKAIVPVPLHPSIIAERGFNQAEEIAQGVSAGLERPCLSNLLTTTRKTKQQSKLSGSEREQNVRGAFAVRDRENFPAGETLLLVDDVTTTGATLMENIRVLREAGAGRIIAAVAAMAV